MIFGMIFPGSYSSKSPLLHHLCFRPGKLEKRDVLQQFCTCKKVNPGWTRNSNDGHPVYTYIFITIYLYIYISSSTNTPRCFISCAEKIWDGKKKIRIFSFTAGIPSWKPLSNHRGLPTRQQNWRPGRGRRCFHNIGKAGAWRRRRRWDSHGFFQKIHGSFFFGWKMRKTPG